MAPRSQDVIAAKVLRCLPVEVDRCNVEDAQGFGNWLVAERSAWLRRNNRHLMTDAAIERERYGVRAGGRR